MWTAGGCPKRNPKERTGSPPYAHVMDPVLPVGMRLLSSDPMKVFLVPSSEAHVKNGGKE
jgi:hypothetical protein